MGYELKLIIGQEYPWADHTMLRRTISHYAEVDLAKPGANSELWKLVDDPDLDVSRPYSIETSVYNEGKNSYEWLSEDMMGRPLIPMKLTDIRDALRKDWEHSLTEYATSTWYRRFYIALKLIDGILETFVEQVVSDEVRESNPLAGQFVAIPWRH